MNGRGNDVTAGQIVKLEFLVPFYHAVAEVGVLTIDLPGFLRADTKLCNERKSLVLSPWFERASWNVSTSVLAKSPDSTRWRPVSGRSNHDDVDQQVIQRVRVDSTIRPLRKGEVVTLLVHGLSSPKAYDDKIQMNGQNNPFEYVRWDSARGRLYLEFGRDVIGELVQASIPYSEGFRVSTRGLRENETFILLDEKVGPAIPNNLNTLPIGYLGTDARITFEDQGEKEGPPKFYAGRRLVP